MKNKSIYIRIIKALLIAIIIIVAVYLAISFSFGGFRNKPVNQLFPDPADSLLMFAHRGVVRDFPENSLESIGEAKRLGFRAVEFDLRKSADGDFILFHDTDAGRMIGYDQFIGDISTAELKKLPFIHHGRTTGFYVPTLTDVLDRFGNDFIFYFDMKLTGFGEADEIAAIIRKYGLEKSVIVASADALFLFYIEMKYPAVITALEGFNAGKEWMYNLIPKNLKPDFLSGFLNRIDEDHVKWLKEQKLLNKRIVYGVDSSNYIAAKNLGIRNMILDYDSASPVFNDLRFLNR